MYAKANYLNPKYREIHLMAEEKLEEVSSSKEEEWNQTQANEEVSDGAENVLPTHPTSQ